MAKVSTKLLMQLKVGNGESFSPRIGRWNFNNKVLFATIMCLLFFCFGLVNLMVTPHFVQKLIEPAIVCRWFIVNFSARCNMWNLVRDLTRLGSMKGIVGQIFLSYACI